MLGAGSSSHWRGEKTKAGLVTAMLLLGFFVNTSVAAVFQIEEKPTLWFEGGSPVHPWDNVTLICKAIQATQVFRLLKDGVAQNPVNLSFSASEYRFPLGKVTEDMRGIYRCDHRLSNKWSRISDLVELTGREKKRVLDQSQNLRREPILISFPFGQERRDLLVTTNAILAENLPPPSLSVQPGPWLIRGVTTTVLCQGPMSRAIFSLVRAGHSQVIKKWIHEEAKAVFPIALAGSYSCSYTTTELHDTSWPPSEPSQTVTIEELDAMPILLKSGNRVENVTFTTKEPGTCYFNFNIQEGGSYTCRYTLSSVQTIWSRDSRPLEIFVSDGSLPKPTLSLVSKDLKLTPGSEVILRCQGSLAGATFVLVKEDVKRPLQVVSATGSSVDISIPEIGVHVSGNYSCLYLKTRNGSSGSGQSETLALRVKGLMPKPLLWSVWSNTVTPGRDILLQCMSPLPDMRYELQHEGKVVIHMDYHSHNNIANFPLFNVGPQHAGNYSCRYYTYDGKSYVSSEDSDPMELRVEKGSL
ncbi:PREDICTED: alpha-1B-glycoprotein-like [Chrysochloris asiatica]|uniref:Alpha-1B-glycoprotein-like n=1 Tax=Chrysochloris asiatica TaxID=185453 RepID=A0A9B0WTP4_CHRAS|nr:PREDICTED: alpha-1B-glycoprotein-like [Chrysochloris asiatica]